MLKLYFLTLFFAVVGRLHSIEIRQLRPDEWSVCAYFVHEAVRENASFFGLDADSSLAITEDQWRQNCSFAVDLEGERTVITFCASMKGEDIGIITLGAYSNPSGFKHGWLGSLYVEPRFRNQGVAKVLIQTALSRAKEWRLEYLDVAIHEKNKGSNKVFDGFGAVHQKTITYTDYTTHCFSLKRLAVSLENKQND